jgi:hypothetical protein
MCASAIRQEAEGLHQERCPLRLPQARHGEELSVAHPFSKPENNAHVLEIPEL